MRFFKRRHEESRGDANAARGPSWEYFATTNSGDVLDVVEQAVVYDGGLTLRYDLEYTDDEFGGLSRNGLLLDEYAEFEIDRSTYAAAVTRLNRQKAEHPLPEPVEERWIEEAERRLGRRLPDRHRRRLMRANGGFIRVYVPFLDGDYAFPLHPVRDYPLDVSADPQHGVHHLVLETLEARSWGFFPTDAICVADAYDGDVIMLRGDSYFWWDHEDPDVPNEAQVFWEA